MRPDATEPQAVHVERLEPVDGDAPRPTAPLGERRLFLAILQDAIYCYQKHVFATKWRGRRLFREVERWFTEPNSGAAISFQTVCEALGIDPAYIRSGLHRWRATQHPESARAFRHPTLRRSAPDRPTTGHWTGSPSGRR